MKSMNLDRKLPGVERPTGHLNRIKFGQAEYPILTGQEDRTDDI